MTRSMFIQLSPWFNNDQVQDDNAILAKYGQDIAHMSHVDAPQAPFLILMS